MSIFKREISPEFIDNHLGNVSRYEYDSRIDPEGEILPPLSRDGGDGVTSIGFRTAITDRRLTGRLNSLRSRTLVAFESLRVPAVLNFEQAELLMNRREMATTAFMKIRLSELSANGSLITEFEGYYLRPHPGRFLAAEGIARYLNLSKAGFLDSAETEDKIDETRRLMLQVKYSHQQIVENFLRSISENT